MSTQNRVQVNPQIVHELIQSEVVAINLATGCYYSLTGAAGEVWSLLSEPLSIEEITETLSQRYGRVVFGHAADIADFVNELRNEELVVDSARTPGSALPTLTAANTIAFAVPVLQKYGDMRDLLMIDPIHEVGETGWPVKPA